MSTVTTASATREHRVTVRSLAARKSKAEPFSMLTAYDFTFARIFDEAGVDVLLVGDSLGNVVQGVETTLPVTVDEVVYHTRLVARGVRRALIVGDMPFGSYQVGPEDAVRTAIRLIKEGGAHAVKLEGGVDVADSVRRIVAAQIPVMGSRRIDSAIRQPHGWLIGFRAAAMKAANASSTMRSALEAAGVFAIVLEGIPEDLGKEITQLVSVPTIGIGAGVHCDAQVLVMHDLLGLNDWTPSFVKQFADLGAQASKAARAYIDEVTNRKFPGEDHVYR